jgi:ABC-type cobalamin/Fe3+-siderophores transport system ATPase subunit
MTLEGRSVAIDYRDGLVGDGLDVALAEGEVLALLGPNGGGKTTLLKTLLGLLPPRAGEVRFGGRSLAPRSIRRKKSAIAAVFDNSHGFTDFEKQASPATMVAVAPRTARRTGGQRQLSAARMPLSR